MRILFSLKVPRKVDKMLFFHSSMNVHLQMVLPLKTKTTFFIFDNDQTIRNVTD